MKKIICFLLVSMVLTSCMTTKRIKRHCDDFAALCITETVKETVYRDTTIFRNDTVLVPLPFRDTVKITDTVKIIDNLAYLPIIHKSFGLIGVDAGVNRSILNVNAYLTDSTILYSHIDTVFLEKAIREEKQTNTITMPPEKYIPKFYKFAFWIVVLELVALAAWLVVKFKLLQLLKRIKLLQK